MQNRSTFALIAVGLGLALLFLWIEGQASRNTTGTDDRWRCRDAYLYGLICLRDTSD